MNNKNFILTILLFAISLYICHDLLPYHNHGVNHVKGHCTEHAHEHHKGEPGHFHEKNDCEGNSLCVTCLLKENSSFRIVHPEIDFSVSQTDISIKDNKLDTPENNTKGLYFKTRDRLKKSKFKRQSHSLRAPPYLT